MLSYSYARKNQVLLEGEGESCTLLICDNTPPEALTEVRRALGRE